LRGEVTLKAGIAEVKIGSVRALAISPWFG
jgi:hypothetical protein